MSFSSAKNLDTSCTTGIDVTRSHDENDEVEVRLNVYNMASLSLAKNQLTGLRHPNKVLCLLGAGAYHSTIEIDGIEYSYSSVAMRD